LTPTVSIHVRFIIVARRFLPISFPKVCPMTTISSRAAAVAVAVSLLLAGPAFAQAPAPAATPAPAAKADKPRSAASIECSKQADEKGLKGKERKKFRKACLKQAKETPAPASK